MLFGPLKKAIEHDQLLSVDDLLAKSEGSIKRSYLDFMRAVRAPSMFTQIRAQLARGDTSWVIGHVDQKIQPTGFLIQKLFHDAGTHEAGLISKKLGRKVIYNPLEHEAIKASNGVRLDFINEFNRKQRLTTRRTLIDAKRRGLNLKDTFVALKESIGLTDYQESVVINYRNLLMKNSADALNRVMRDKKMDGAVRQAIRRGKPLTQVQIDRAVKAYRENFLVRRAKTIARTEALKSINGARFMAMQQAAAQTDYNEDQVVRTWHSMQDARVRDTHQGLDGAEVEGMEQPFESESGALLMYPGDPNAPPDETVNCFHPSTLIGLAGLKGVVARDYSGVLIELTFADGANLSVTPNHPILTKRGWVSAGELVKGDYLIQHSVGDNFLVQPQNEYRYAAAQSLANLAERTGHICRVTNARVNFHGDVPNHDVEVIAFPRKLWDTLKSSFFKPFYNLTLHNTDISQGALLALCLTKQLSVSPGGHSSGLLALLHRFSNFCWGHLGKSASVSFRSAWSFNAKIVKTFINESPLYTQHLSNGFGAVTFFKQICDVFVQFPAVVLSLFTQQNAFAGIRFGGTVFSEPKVFDAGINDVATNANFFSYTIDGHASFVERFYFWKKCPALCLPVRLNFIRIVSYHGPVFNFETANGLIIANGIITHNCRCFVSYRMPKLRKPKN